MIALRWPNINFLKKKATIEEAVVRFNRQETKTDKIRMVDLPGPAIEALLSQKEFTFMKSHDHVFENPLTGVPWVSDEAFREAHWVFACKAAGVNYRTPVMLRHGFASLMFERDKPLGWIANQMGNSVEVMARHYARWLDKNKVEMDDLSDLWDSICTNPVGIEEKDYNLPILKENLALPSGCESERPISLYP